MNLKSAFCLKPSGCSLSYAGRWCRRSIESTAADQRAERNCETCNEGAACSDTGSRGLRLSGSGLVARAIRICPSHDDKGEGPASIVHGFPVHLDEAAASVEGPSPGILLIDLHRQLDSPSFGGLYEKSAQTLTVVRCINKEGINAVPGHDHEAERLVFPGIHDDIGNDVGEELVLHFDADLRERLFGKEVVRSTH